MNSEMFMMWVENNLVPAFENVYPNKIMILVAKNAPYHREIGSLQATSKKKLLEMMVKYDIDTVDLPVTDSRFELSKESDSMVEDRGEIVRVQFNLLEKRAGLSL
jgi:hypothetical protein